MPPSPAGPGVGHLLVVAAVAVLALLILIIRLRTHPLLALVLVSAGTALAAGVPPGAVVDVLDDGFADTIGQVALLVGFGAVFARLVEVSGGAEALSDALLSRLGEGRAPLALGIASLLFGFPIFFDAALLVILPIVFTVARRLGGGVLVYALPAASALSVMQVLLPPHPGTVATTVLLGADLGLVLLLGLVVAVPTWLVAGHFYGGWIGRRIVIPVPDVLVGGPRVDDGDGAAGEGPVSTRTRVVGVRTVLALILLPVLLIGAATAATAAADVGAVAEDAWWVGLLQLLGHAPVALLLTVLVAAGTLARHTGGSGAVLEDLVDHALRPVAPIILITGAGGMFGGVLLASGIGDALAGVLGGIGLPLIVSIFLVAGTLRVVLGTSTVAATTAASLLAGSVAATDPNPVQTAALVLALSGGSTILPHVNDNGFWLVGKLLGMELVQTLKTWTVIKTLVGVCAFGLATVIYLLAS